MTGIAFHFNVPDKLAYGCRLVRKAYLSGARIAVTAEPALLAEFDALLWRFSPAEFVPHCAAHALSTTVRATPIVLAASPADCSDREVLVNLGQGIPAGFEGFARLIEVVSMLPQDVQTGRDRWKHYAKRGYDLVRHDLAKTGAGA
ncbi:MAG: polymerase chi subunit [Polaromonas sp.]|nr:polymerase chi subunit [Polaromonas sp.]